MQGESRNLVTVFGICFFNPKPKNEFINSLGEHKAELMGTVQTGWLCLLVVVTRHELT